MDEKLSYNTRVYSDIQSLSRLKYDKNTQAAKKEVAQQFESILMQMVLHSMRSASKAFSSDTFGSDQMEMYQDMFDNQLSLSLSNSKNGLASMIETNLAQREASIQYKANEPASMPVVQTEIKLEKKPDVKPIKKHFFESQEDFIKSLWASAKKTAALIGAKPEILIAQAALETNWGKNIIPHGKSGSSFSLFNIKADETWTKASTKVASLEQTNGILAKVKSRFRSYDSFYDSFVDYIHFLKKNVRYSDALSKANHPEQFFHALQNAGYATDSNYAEKILKIFSNHHFQNLIAKVKQEI